MKSRIHYHASPIAGIDPMTAVTTRSFPRHVHDQYGIGLVDEGGHASWSGKGPVEAGPGTFISVNPGEVHDGHAIGGDGRAWRMLYIDPQLMRQLCLDIQERAPAEFEFSAPVFEGGELHRLFDVAFAHATHDVAHDTMRCESSVLGLVAHLLRHSTLQAANSRESGRASIRRARQRIDDDPAAPVTLTALAREAGLSRYQLLRSFARELGLTPHAYILQRRLALARRLIRGGEQLAVVASAAGFYDQSHMNRWFTRQFGVSPGRYAARAA